MYHGSSLKHFPDRSPGLLFMVKEKKGGLKSMFVNVIFTKRITIKAKNMKQHKAIR